MVHLTLLHKTYFGLPDVVRVYMFHHYAFVIIECINNIFLIYKQKQNKIC